MTSHVLEILTFADTLLSEPDKWTKGALARDKQGDAIGVEVPDACKWCLLGAIRLAFKGKPQFTCLDELEAFKVLVGEEGGVVFSVSAFNDAPPTTFAMVKTRLAAASATLKLGCA